MAVVGSAIVKTTAGANHKDYVKVAQQRSLKVHLRERQATQAKSILA
jgi:hypothetical protein